MQHQQQQGNPAAQQQQQQPQNAMYGGLDHARFGTGMVQAPPGMPGMVQGPIAASVGVPPGRRRLRPRPLRRPPRWPPPGRRLWLVRAARPALKTPCSAAGTYSF